jgi:hypothetical protein
MFQRYPLPTVAAAIEPTTGLPSKCKFLPTLAEVKDFCDEHCRPAGYQVHQAAIAAQQLEDRRKREEELRRRPGPTFERLWAEVKAALAAPPEKRELRPGDTVTWRDMGAHGKRAFGPFEPGRGQALYDSRLKK